MILLPHHDLSAIQLSACVLRELHTHFYADCRHRGVTDSDMLRSLIESFVRLTDGAPHGQA